jgi:phosphate transport system protein
MERHFDQELDDLKKDLLRMGSLVETAIFESVEALKSLDADRAQRVIDSDREVDSLENAIDEKTLDLLVLRQPVASDMRFIAMAMKIATDLERMADLAVDVAQRVVDLAVAPLLKPLIDIPQLALVAQRMTRGALDAFVAKDAEQAAAIILRDQEADLLRNAIQQELMEDFMMKDPASVPRAVPLLLVARHLERICDHATNIAENVIYMVNAKVVKHRPENLPPSS